MAGLTSLEELAAHDLVQERAKTAALFLRLLDDAGDRRAVAVGDAAAGGVDCKLFGEVLEELRAVGGEQVFQVGDAAEFAAIGHLAGRVDGLRELEVDLDERVDCAALGGRLRVFRLAHGAVAVALAADDIEGLQREISRTIPVPA